MSSNTINNLKHDTFKNPSLISFVIYSLHFFYKTLLNKVLNIFTIMRSFLLIYLFLNFDFSVSNYAYI